MDATPWQRLEDAAALARTAADLDRRLASTEAELADERLRLQALTTALAVEESEVEDLESVSLTRIRAALLGHREADLTRARAEVLAAAHAERVQADRVAALRRRREETARARSALGDVTAALAAAEQAVEQELITSGAAASGELADIAGARARAQARDAEIVEALTAATGAQQALAAALDRLDRAGDWATYDTFFGGGLFTDAMKYDRLDEAQALLRSADAALRAFGRELADVGMPAVDGVATDTLVTTFDVWFDNLFSDWAMRTRINEAAERTSAALGVVRSAQARLAEEQRALAAERERLQARRAELLRDRA